jgi:hypothetical protein
MVKDGAVSRSAEFFEGIIEYCRSAQGRASAFDFSDRQGRDQAGVSAVDALLERCMSSAPALNGHHF